MVRGIEKIYLIVFAFICMFFLTVRCNDLETYLQAKKECQAKNISQAIKLFESLPQKGDAVLYNIGVCYFQKGDVSRAVAYLHLALSKASYALFPAITQSINQVGTQYSLSVPHGIKWYLARLGTLFSLVTWQLLIIICLLLLLITAYWAGKKVIAPTLILALLISIYLVKNQIINYPLLMVESDTAALQVSPDQDLAPIEILQKGTFVKLLQKADQWYKIRHHNKTGWVKKGNLVTDDQ